MNKALDSSLVHLSTTADRGDTCDTEFGVDAATLKKLRVCTLWTRVLKWNLRYEVETDELNKQNPQESIFWMNLSYLSIYVGGEVIG